MSDIRQPLPGNSIDGAGPVKQTAAMLFYGWGYNWYRKENQLRADDLLIRSKVSDYLQQARASLASLESAYRARYLPPPSRQNPLPDPEAVAQARLLHELGDLIGDVETQVRTASVPENDKVWQRYRVEKDSLTRLSQIDTEMVDIAILLAESLAGVTAEAGARTDFIAEFKHILEQFRQVFRQRLIALQI